MSLQQINLGTSPSGVGGDDFRTGSEKINQNFQEVDESLEQMNTALNQKADGTALSEHVSNTSNPHSVTKAQVGLGNVDNTSDANKPVSTATQTALNQKADGTALSEHASNTSNPHSVTKAQVGLGNVDNTSDANKPVSTATQTALNQKADGTVLSEHASNTSNPHSVTKTQVGLGNVDNTSDANKPVSTATQTALSQKVNNTDLAAVAKSGSFADLSNVPSATATAKGVIQLATSTEALAGDSEKALTAATLRAAFNASGAAPLFPCYAFLAFSNIQATGTYSQTGATITVTMTAHNVSVGNKVYLTFTTGLAASGLYTVTSVTSATVFTVESATSQTTSGNVTKNLVIYKSGNILGISDDGVGLFTITFINPLPSADYVPVAIGVSTNAQQPVFKMIGTAVTALPTTKTVSSIQMGHSLGTTATDSIYMTIAFLGG